jgi:hypothetical protein
MSGSHGRAWYIFLDYNFVSLFQKLQLLHTVLSVNIMCDIFLHVRLTGGSNHKVSSFLKQMVRIVVVS